MGGIKRQTNGQPKHEDASTCFQIWGACFGITGTYTLSMYLLQISYQHAIMRPN